MKTLTTVATAFALAVALAACDNKQPTSQPAAVEARVVCQQYTQLKPLGAKQETEKSDSPAQACVAMR